MIVFMNSPKIHEVIRYYQQQNSLKTEPIIIVYRTGPLYRIDGPYSYRSVNELMDLYTELKKLNFKDPFTMYPNGNKELFDYVSERLLQLVKSTSIDLTNFSPKNTRVCVHDTGIPVIISGPSGVGKGAIVEKLLSIHPSATLSVSYTNRQKREKEVDGVHYNFVTRGGFEKLAAEDRFIEWDRFGCNYYGTPRLPLETNLKEGKDVILEIEPKGAMKVMRELDEYISIYILPPSWAEVKRRLENRGTDSDESIQRRLTESEKELKYIDRYEHILVNNDRCFDECAEVILSILISHRHKTKHVLPSLMDRGWKNLLQIK